MEPLAIKLNRVPVEDQFGPGAPVPLAMFEPEGTEPGQVGVLVFEDRLEIHVALAILKFTGHTAMSDTLMFVAGVFGPRPKQRLCGRCGYPSRSRCGLCDDCDRHMHGHAEDSMQCPTACRIHPRGV